MMKKIITMANIYAALAVFAMALWPVTSVAETTVPQIEITGYVGIGSDDVTKSFIIRNAGGGTLVWSIGEIEYIKGSGWITSVSPLSGETETEEISIVTIVSYSFFSKAKALSLNGNCR